MAFVNLQRPWAVGGNVYRPADNPIEVDDRFLDRLPSTAKVVKEKPKPKAAEEPKALSQLKQDQILPTKA